MRRWHSEKALMLRRWKHEMSIHGYDWRNPPDPKCDHSACHCAAGIGSMRKKKPLDCGRPRCLVCHSEKFLYPKARANKKRDVIAFEMEAML